MGLAALRKVLNPQPFDPVALRGRTLAVDADNILWSFVTAMGAGGAMPTAPDGRPIAHLIGLGNRLKLYASWGARSAWVFDGEQPALKEATLAARSDRIDAAREAGNVGGGISLSAEDIAESKELLTRLGVPWMVAPGESDAQCAHFARVDAAWAAVTQDYDIALHGAPRALRNLSGSKTRQPELLDLDASLAAIGASREELVDAAVLVGTDYNTGVKGVGPVKALKLVKKHGGLRGALAALGVEMPEGEDVRALFLAHPVDSTAELRFGTPDEAAVVAFLGERGLGERRARDVAAAVAEVHAT